MEYVNSLKDAIYVCLERHDYDKNNIDIIRNFINKAIIGDTKYFTRTKGAREYIERNLANNGIIKEIVSVTQSISENINELVEEYINVVFRKKDKAEEYKKIKESIKNNSNLDKVNQKLRYLNTSSSNDQVFLNNRWTTFTNIFSGNDTNISSEEIRYDMIYTALEKAEDYRENATILKQIDPKSNELTKMDVIRIVEEYVYSNKINNLFDIINQNPTFSGLLLQNLFDYVEEEKNNKYSLYELDKKLEQFNNVKIRSNILIKILNGDKIEGIDIDKEQLLVDLLKNTLSLNMYTNNKRYMDYEERKLYTGQNNNPEDVIQNRIITNNEIANNLIVNGMNTSIEDLKNIINNLNDKEKYFLANIYVLSRSIKSNRYKLDNSIYYGNKVQIRVYELLEKEELIKLLKQSKQNTL